MKKMYSPDEINSSKLLMVIEPDEDNEISQELIDKIIQFKPTWIKCILSSFQTYYAKLYKMEYDGETESYVYIAVHDLDNYVKLYFDHPTYEGGVNSFYLDNESISKYKYELKTINVDNPTQVIKNWEIISSHKPFIFGEFVWYCSWFSTSYIQYVGQNWNLATNTLSVRTKTFKISDKTLDTEAMKQYTLS